MVVASNSYLDVYPTVSGCLVSISTLHNLLSRRKQSLNITEVTIMTPLSILMSTTTIKVHSCISTAFSNLLKDLYSLLKAFLSPLPTVRSSLNNFLHYQEVSHTFKQKIVKRKTHSSES